MFTQSRECIHNGRPGPGGPNKGDYLTEPNGEQIQPQQTNGEPINSCGGGTGLETIRPRFSGGGIGREILSALTQKKGRRCWK